MEALSLDRLLLVPARVSPFKQDAPVTPGEIRVRLLEAAVAGDPAMEVWRGEVDRPGPSYTVDTLRELQRAFPGASLFLLMGEDQWASFSGWREPDAILSMAAVCVLHRAGGSEAAVGGDHPHRQLPTRRMDVSSSEVRERVAAGRSVRYLVPESVRALIHEQRLYDPAASRGV